MLRVTFVALISATALTGCLHESNPPPPSDVDSAVQRLLNSIDTDGDGIGNGDDPWPFFAGIPIDSDGDGLPNRIDPFPLSVGVPTTPTEPAAPDTDGDGVIDVNDTYAAGEDQRDSDGDGQSDAVDQLFYDINVRSMDSDGDFTPNWLDDHPSSNEFADDDGDGYSNGSDPYRYKNDDVDQDYHFDDFDDNTNDPNDW
jgi:hypothetical protein